MIRVIVLGMGMVASHYVVGLEKIRRNEVKPYGVPLARFKLPYRNEDVNIVGVYDVDKSKVNKTVYEVALKLIGDQLTIPTTLKDIVVRRGIHLGSLIGLPFSAKGIEDEVSVKEAIEMLVDEWKTLKPDIIVNVITTEYGRAFEDTNALHEETWTSRLKIHIENTSIQ